MPKSQLPDPEVLCNQILKAAKHQGPPTDLEAVCSLWPNLSLAEEDLEKEGYLVPIGMHTAEILVRRQDPAARKRFTIAHELGHWVLGHQQSGRLLLGTSSLDGVVLSWNHKRQSPEEAWCNRFAAALLMPRADLYRFLHSGDIARITLRATKGHPKFGVSQEAFLHRVTDTTRLSLAEIVSDTKYRIRRTYLSKHDRDGKLDVILGRLTAHLENVGPCIKRDMSLDGYYVYSELTGPSGRSTIWVSLMPEDSTIIVGPDEH